MKTIFIIFILLSSILTSLSAKNIYIKVKAFQDTGLLFNLSYNLREYGYKVSVREYKDWLIVYAGPFSDETKAKRALVTIRSNISKSAKYAGFSISKKTRTTQKQNEEIIATPKAESEVYLNPYRNTRFFIGITAGISMFDIEQTDTDGTIILDYHPNNAGFTYGTELGYYFNKKFFITLNYQRTDLENMIFNNMFATMNYKFDKIASLYPYIGVLGGYNIMEWVNYPVATTTKQENSSSFFAGFQVGNDIPLTKHFTMYMLYRYLFLDNTTEITISPATKEIVHNSEQSLNFGIKYNF